MAAYKRGIERFLERGPGDHWSWTGPRDKYGKPISFATRSKATLDPGIAIFRRHNYTKRTAGANGKLLRTCGMVDCMNPEHFRLQPHQTTGLANAKVRRPNRKLALFVDPLAYLRWAEREERGIYGHESAIARAKQHAASFRLKPCPVCTWPLPACGCKAKD